MIWKNRIISALCAIVVTAALTFAVVKLSPAAARSGYETVHEGLTYRVTGIADDAQVLHVADNSAPADLFTYWLGNNYAYWDQMLQMYTGSGIDPNGTMPGGQSVGEFLYEDSLRTIKQQLVLENLARQYGIDISDEAEAEIAETRQKYIDYFGGVEGYRAELAKLGVSEASYERVRRSDYLYSALYQLYMTPGSKLAASDEELLAFARELGYITADHILLKTLNDDGSPMDEAAAAAVRAKAEDLLAQLRASDDHETLFARLADEYGEDPGRDGSAPGYTFTTGAMVAEFEDAAYALEPGELSDIVETTYGYHILLRRELDETAAIEAVRGDYFEQFVAEQVENAEITVDPALESVDTMAIYQALQEAQAADAEN